MKLGEHREYLELIFVEKKNYSGTVNVKNMREKTTLSDAYMSIQFIATQGLTISWLKRF